MEVSFLTAENSKRVCFNSITNYHHYHPDPYPGVYIETQKGGIEKNKLFL